MTDSAPASGTSRTSDNRPVAGRRRSIAMGTAWVALLGLFFIPVLAAAVESAFHFSGSAIDGPFQLYNALRRIAAGFHPGTDFQFFHGVGIPYLHYWLFRLFGGQFADSELARQLVASVVFPLSSLVFYRAFTGSWIRATCLTAITLALVIWLRFPALLYAVNSMIGVRSALPMLVPAVLYLSPDRRIRVIGGGATLGCALFLSTEQGLAAVGAFLIVSAVTVLRSDTKRAELLAAIMSLGIAFIVLFVALALVGGFAGAIGALRYNYRLVPMDQYWFFGAPPNPFAPSWAEGARMAIRERTVGLALLFGSAAAAWYVVRLWRGGSKATNRDRALALLALYGFLSCASLLGVFVPVYSLPCWRVLIGLALIELTAWGERRAGVRETAAPLRIPTPVVVAAIIVSITTLLTRRAVISAWAISVPHVVSKHVVRHSSFEVRGIWPQTLAIDSQVVEAHRNADGSAPIIWSTYSGWMEARAGVFNPSFDYLIHALGPENRRAYLNAFLRARPALVQTVSPLYSPYEVWIENTTWDLYRLLLDSYAVTAETQWSLLWERVANRDSTPLAVTSIDMAPGTAGVRLPAAPKVGPWPVTLLQVELEYEASNPFRWLPLIGPSPRYLVNLEGALSQTPVSLDPYATVARFPIVAAPGQTPALTFRALSLLPGAKLVVRRVRVTVIPVHARNEAWFRSLAQRLTH